MIFEENVPNESLRRARHLKGWTQSELAECVGTDFETVSRWERGITVPSAYFREQLCATLEKTPQELGLLVDRNEPLTSSTSDCVFLAASYADAECEFVTDLKMHLQARGVTALSTRTLRRRGGESQSKVWQEAIRTAQAVLLIVSPEARSSRHVQKALQMADVYKRPLFSIWIEGESWQGCLPPGCGVSVAIDARARKNNDQRVFDEIMAKLERVGLISNETAVSLAPTNESVEPPAEPRNPYKGLQAFHGEDQGDFFGREALVGELAGALNACLIVGEEHSHGKRLLAVIGPSGSGKSSVVMAGLLPRLQKDGLPGSQEWVYLEPMLPGSHPIESLAVALAKHLPQRSLKTIRDDLEDDSAYGLYSLANCLRKTPEMRVLLLIDQFEEVFTLTISEDERQHFMDLLVTAVTEPRGSLIVVLTLRADFYDRPMNYPELSTLIKFNQILVPPMDLKELREVIEKPAALPDVQLMFEGDLVSDLLFDVQEQVGALPLLQFTLDQLFQRRSGHQIMLKTYHEIGGVKGAVARHAEATYTSLPSEEHRKLARVLFLRLIEPGATVQETTRRRITRSELLLSNPKETVIIDEVLRAFITARLLTTSATSAGSTAEVSHEAVIREWTRLSDWLDEAREDVHHQHTISQDAAEWVQHGKPRDRLYRGSQLKEAQAWATRNTSSGSEVTFLRASVAHQRRSHVVLAAFCILAVLLLFFTGFANRQLLFPPDPTLVTNLSNNGPGSLRLAIDMSRPGSTITFSANVKGVIKLAGNLSIDKDLRIQGPGAGKLSITGDGTYNVIHVQQGITTTISDIAFKGTNQTVSGMAIVDNYGTLTLANSIVSDNATWGGAGAISNMGKLTVTNCIIANNTTSSAYGGGIGNYGGTVTISNSTISGNTAFAGAGIFNNGGPLTLNNSSVSDNRTSDGGWGGGIFNVTGGTLTLTNSTVSGNKAVNGLGGGINNGYSNLNDNSAAQFKQGGSVSLINSTISDNTATYGGGILTNADDPVTITFCTIYGNVAQKEGGIAIVAYTYTDHPTLRAKMRNSIVAFNRADTWPNIAGRLISEGYNLVQNVPDGTFAASGQHLTDIVVASHTDLRINPVLSGKQPQVYALLAGSPAIDRIPLSSCLVNGISTDERGVKRPDGQEQSCDIGAYEYVDA